MAAVSITDLNNAKLDVDHIDRVATSPAPTSTDRLGRTVPTLAALISEFPQAAANAALSVVQAQAAIGAATTALGALAGAQAARDAAVAAAEIVGDYQTLAAATAAMAAQPDNKACTVSADGSNNGYYVKRSGVLVRESVDTLQAVAARNFQQEAADDWAIKIVDAVRRMAVGVDRAGETYLRLRQDAQIGTDLLASRLVAPGIGTLLQIVAGIVAAPAGMGIAGVPFTTESNEDYSLVVMDGSRRASDLAIGRDGLFKPEVVKRLTARLDPADLGLSFVARLPAVDRYTAQITGATPTRNLYVASQTAGTRRLVTTAGDPRDAYIVSNTYVFWTDNTGVQWYAPCAGGSPYPVYPELAGVSYGDSLTASVGTDWPSLIGAALGIPWVNAGVSGQASSDIALRQGGLVPTVAITGGSIPASGAVGLAISPVDAWRNGSGTGTFTWSGTIAGIAGTLAHDYGTNTWTFTRTAAGSATAVPAGTPFLITTPTYDTRIQTLFAGYNNQFSTGTRTTALRDYASMVANIKTYHKWYLVFGFINSATEPNGSGGLADVLSLNAQLASTYGSHYFDYRTWLINDGLAAAGLTPTPQDATDQANGIVPTSLRIPGDPVHLVPAAYAAIAPKVRSLMTNLGWTI